MNIGLQLPGRAFTFMHDQTIQPKDYKGIIKAVVYTQVA